MNDMAATLLAADQLERRVQSFLDYRFSGCRDLVVGGSGIVLCVFRGHDLQNPRATTWREWGFAGLTVIEAFKTLKSLNMNSHQGFWAAPSHNQFNWYIYESKNS